MGGLTEIAGDAYTLTATAQTSWRLDTKAVRDHLGALATRFETIATTTVIRIKSADRAVLAQPLAVNVSRCAALPPAVTRDEVVRIAAILSIADHSAAA